METLLMQSVSIVWRLRIGRRSEICEFQTQVSGIGGVAESGFQIDASCATEFFNFTIEVLHSLVVSNPHSVKQGLAFGFTFFHVSRVRKVDFRISIAATRPLPSL